MDDGTKVPKNRAVKRGEPIVLNNLSLNISGRGRVDRTPKYAKRKTKETIAPEAIRIVSNLFLLFSENWLAKK